MLCSHWQINGSEKDGKLGTCEIIQVRYPTIFQLVKTAEIQTNMLILSHLNLPRCSFFCIVLSESEHSFCFSVIELYLQLFVLYNQCLLLKPNHVQRDRQEICTFQLIFYTRRPKRSPFVDQEDVVQQKKKKIIYFHPILRWFKSGIVLVLTQSMEPAKTQNTQLYLHVNVLQKPILFQWIQKNWFVTCNQKQKTCVFKSGAFLFKCFIYRQSYSKFRSKVV